MNIFSVSYILTKIWLNEFFKKFYTIFKYIFRFKKIHFKMTFKFKNIHFFMKKIVTGQNFF